MPFLSMEGHLTDMTVHWFRMAFSMKLLELSQVIYGFDQTFTCKFAALCAIFINYNHTPMLNARSYVCMLVIFQTSVTLVAQRVGFYQSLMRSGNQMNGSWNAAYQSIFIC